MLNNLPYRIRLYRDTDYDKVLDKVVSKRFLNKYLNKPIHFQFLKVLRLYDSSFYVLEDANDHIVAVGVIRRKFSISNIGYTYWFYGIHVINEYRGIGIGLILVSEMIDILRRKNVDIAFLKVEKSNIPAVKLYHKLGFLELTSDSTQSIFYMKLA